MNTDRPNRRYELDWLRIFAILIVFLYHSTRFFNLGDWHVKNIDTYVWVEMWNMFVTRWMMPLFFVISGASLFFAITKFGRWSTFYVAKFLRLMVPVLVASVTHAALQVYLDRVAHGQFPGSFFEFLPEYFDGVYLAIGMPGNFAFHGMHLWYLLFLFLYSLICYPLFAWLKGRGRKILDKMGEGLAAPGLMLAGFSMPLVLLKLFLPGAVMAVGNGGWGFLYYIWFLVSGFIIVSNDRLQERIKDQRWLSLLLGAGLSAAYLYLLFGRGQMAFPVWVSAWLVALLSFCCAWCWLLAILGFGMQFLAFDHSIRQTANETVMPFYILHQTVLLSIGYFVMTWKIPDIMKWGIVFGGAMTVVLMLCRLFIQKFEALRFLFGMKTTHAFFSVFKKRSVIAILSLLYVVLILFAVLGASRSRSPMPMQYAPGQDIILNSASITDRSQNGIRIVKDEAASLGEAIEFFSGANSQAKAQPNVYVEMRFFAPAGRYTVWIRGKTDLNNGYTDSVWVQVDDQIGTQTQSVRMGNWLDVHPVGVYGWAGDTDDPVSITLKNDGEHTLRVQPRQTPHRIDQIWLSRFQDRIPDTHEPIQIPCKILP
jgi:peptidoglycan/LPS O-acetylase OafA/YrhL